MKPADVVTDPKRNWCLSEPGRTYLVYALKGGRFRLDLSNAPGTFFAGWLDPRTGLLASASGDTVAGDRVLAFNPPDSTDWALLLRTAE